MFGTCAVATFVPRMRNYIHEPMNVIIMILGRAANSFWEEAGSTPNIYTQYIVFLHIYQESRTARKALVELCGSFLRIVCRKFRRTNCLSVLVLLACNYNHDLREVGWKTSGFWNCRVFNFSDCLCQTEDWLSVRLTQTTYCIDLCYI